MCMWKTYPVNFPLQSCKSNRVQNYSPTVNNQKIRHREATVFKSENRQYRTTTPGEGNKWSQLFSHCGFLLGGTFQDGAQGRSSCTEPSSLPEGRSRDQSSGRLSQQEFAGQSTRKTGSTKRNKSCNWHGGNPLDSSWILIKAAYIEPSQNQASICFWKEPGSWNPENFRKSHRAREVISHWCQHTCALVYTLNVWLYLLCFCFKRDRVTKFIPASVNKCNQTHMAYCGNFTSLMPGQ